MAKRKRLGPAIMAGQSLSDGASDSVPAELETKSATPPIARVAGDAAAEAAVRELSDEIARARSEGRLVQDIALADVDAGHMARDRVSADEGELSALMASIAARGQQMPIEVVDRGVSDTPRYGLISGWRRLTAVRRLAEDAPGRYPTIRAVLRRPESAAEAYLSMVEENELRVGLSYYERAQVVARATELGVFDSHASALNGLFPTASKAKRSKINTFIRVVEGLGRTLRFPEAIPERLGLRLAKALDAGAGPHISTSLKVTAPKSAAEEQARLERIVTRTLASKPARTRPKPPQPGGISVSRQGDSITLSGANVDDAFMEELVAWLGQRNKRRR
ncbi:MAG: ParB N-terminal domain-containing protein [Pseudomonadota bacterium]